jgi:aryl-alcohol dehydrogenase-like predicted oxidoreductase
MKAMRGNDVDYVKLGSAGLKVSRICLGMMSYGSQAERAWHLDEATAEPIIKAAIDGGITFFDTADTYSDGVSEQITGRLLGRLFARREDYVLATKVYFPMGPGPNDRGLSRKHVLAAIDASLQRLGTDYVDLRGAPPAQVALAWLLSRPGVTAPIIGATRQGHITDALAAAQLTLTDEEVRRLEEPYVPHPVLGHS